MTMTLGQALSVIDRSIRTLREAGYPEQADELIEARRPVSAQFAHPAQSVDVQAIKEVVIWLRTRSSETVSYRVGIEQADKLTAALQEKG